MVWSNCVLEAVLEAEVVERKVAPVDTMVDWWARKKKEFSNM